MTFKTDLCDLLGIEYPIVQSGMGSVAGPDLCIEVSNAGGLGVVAALNQPADEVRRRIRQVKAGTARPFGVNLWLHTELMPPTDMTTVPDAVVQAVQSTLNGFRERLGLPPRQERPPSNPDLVGAAFEVLLEERVPVWSIGLGNPSADMVRRSHERGMKIMAMVATVDDARAVAASGVDIVVAQGAEAGGHRSTWVKGRTPESASVGLVSLLPQILDAVHLPVLASGGIADGRGLVAALALGASGVLLGTRFVATRESGAPEFWKKALLEQSGEATVITDSFTGLYARALGNTYTREYEASGSPVLPALVQSRAAQDIVGAAATQQDREYFPMWSGQSVGLIHDLPGAGEVVEAIVREARAVLAELPRRIRLG
jgi:nitronate monooxygenase